MKKKDREKKINEFWFCLQVSGSKLWQTERSCMCCQESGEREATVLLHCPKANAGEPRIRKVNQWRIQSRPCSWILHPWDWYIFHVCLQVVTKAPVECMCRPCTAVEESAVMPQEIARYVDEGSYPFQL